MLKKSFFTFASVCLCISLVVGQSRLDETFYQYEVLSIDSRAERANTEAGFFEMEFSVANREISWVFDLHQSNIIGDDYKVQYTDGTEVKIRKGTTAVPTQGYIKGMPESRVSITFNDGFVYGYVFAEGMYHYIEPLSYYSTTAKTDQFVFYSQADLKPTAEKTCAVDMQKHAIHDPGNGKKYSGSRAGECFEVDYAIANDFLMFQTYGSIAGVENHAIGVTNNVQTNYDDEFADEVQLVIVEQFVVTTTGGDPWTSSTDAGTFLDDFSDWGPSGFSTTHDIGSIWTDRNFDGSTIGIAWVGAVCTGNRYNALQDFTNNAQTKRVMVAHEIGHNFNASHDASGSGFIMAPSVNNTTTWSTTSINSINNHIASRWCLANCAVTVTPPTAGFIFNQIGDCAAVQVDYSDESLGSNLEYSWSFPGGSPNSSTEANPTVFYFDQGVFDATLTVSNSSGSSTDEQLGIITVNDAPDPSFFFDVDGATVTFDNITLNADSYTWDFGDGNTSTEVSPVHTYEGDDTYLVIFTASNSCGSTELTQLVTVATPPIPAFSNSTPVGCAPFTVNYFNESSSNVNDLQWEFEGGTPSVSADPNPIVTYDVPGVFDVILTVSNDQGVETLVEEDLVTVYADTEADFTYLLTGTTVEFNNQSINADSYSWDFGDGGTSILEDPEYTYTESGMYTIELTATGDCGTSVHTETINIVLSPMAAFSTVLGTTSGCSPFTVEFLNSSTNNADSYLWTFEGGEPATSTEESPTVVFSNPGTFDVQLIATSSLGADTLLIEDYIVVQVGPTAAPTYTSDGLVVDFLANATNVSFFNWDFGDGTIATGIDPSHTYDEQGTYSVTLVVGNDCGQVTTTFDVDAYQEAEANFTAAPTILCEGGVVQFNSDNSLNATSYFWNFEGGTPSTSSEANPSVTYSTSGVFDVSLLVSNAGNGDEVLMTDLITVDAALAATFSSVTNGLTVEFTNETQGATSLLWDFGDGTTSTEENPVHEYQAEDVYNVTLTVTNSCGANSSSEDVNLFSPATAGFEVSSSEGCAPFEVVFTDMSSSNTTAWEWTFSGGTPATSTMQNPTVIFQEAGSHEVTLTASNPAGAESVSVVIEVSDVADAAFEFTKNQLEISFTNTSTNGDSFEWDFGDGNSSTEENPVHSYEVEGEYNVILEVTNDCGTSTTTQAVQANSLPSAGFAVSGQVTDGCTPFEVTFMDESSSNVESRLWDFPGGTPASSTEVNPTVVYTEPGVYDVKLTVTAEAGTDEIFQEAYISVGDVPSPDFEGEVTGRMGSFTYTGGDYSTILWDFGNGTTSTEENPTVQYEEDGTYLVTLTVTNECGSEEISETFAVMTTAVMEHNSFSFELYPNPASDQFTIVTERSAKMTLLDITGKVVMSKRVENGQPTSTEMLQEGTYIIQVVSDNSDIGYKKLVIFK